MSGEIPFAIPLRYHHVKVLEVVARNFQAADVPKDSNGRRIPLEELYLHPYEALGVALNLAGYHTQSLVTDYKQVRTNIRLMYPEERWEEVTERVCKHIQDKIGVEGDKGVDYTLRFGGALKILLTVPPWALAVVSNDLDMICRACIRINEQKVGFHCTDAGPLTRSLDYTHQVVLQEFVRTKFSPGSKEAEFQSAIKREDNGERERFIIPFGVLRQEAFLKAYEDVRRRAWLARIIETPDL